MADSRLRKFERAFFESGSVGDEVTWRREQIRVGELPKERAIVAARCGHPALRLALPDVEPLTNWLEPQLLVEEDVFLLVAILACRHYRRFWNLRLPIEDPVAWVEGLGGNTHYWADEDFRQVRLRMRLDGEEVDGSVPFSRLTTAYPGFNNEEHWVSLLALMREKHYSKGKDYILEPLLWEIPDIVDEFRKGKLKKQQLEGFTYLIYGQAHRTDAEWAAGLIGMAIGTEFSNNYKACLTACLSAEGTHEAINRGVVEWALT